MSKMVIEFKKKIRNWLIFYAQLFLYLGKTKTRSMA